MSKKQSEQLEVESAHEAIEIAPGISGNGILPICDVCLSKAITPKPEDVTKYCHKIIYRI